MDSFYLIKALHEEIARILHTMQYMPPNVRILRSKPSVIEKGMFSTVKKRYSVSSRLENFRESGWELVDPQTASGRSLAGSLSHQQNILCALIRVGNALLDLAKCENFRFTSPDTMGELAYLLRKAEANAQELVKTTKQELWYADEPKNRLEEDLGVWGRTFNRIQVFSDLVAEVEDEAIDS